MWNKMCLFLHQGFNQHILLPTGQTATAVTLLLGTACMAAGAGSCALIVFASEEYFLQ